MKKLLVILVALPFALALLTPTVLAQADPMAVVQRYQTALDNGDVDGALAVLTDDAVREDPGTCSVPCVGKAAIRKSLESTVAGSRLSRIVGGYQVSGNIVTSRTEQRSAAISAAGVERVINIVTYEVRGDKISAVRVKRDTSDPQTAAFLKAQAAAQSLPTTGGGPGLNDALLFALAGLGMLSLGWTLLRRDRR